NPSNYDVTQPTDITGIIEQNEETLYDIVITLANPDPKKDLNEEPEIIFEKDEELSSDNKAVFTASKNHCGIENAQFQITLPDPDAELKIDGNTQASTQNANGLKQHDIDLKLGEQGALDTLIYSLHKNNQELRTDTAIIVSPIPFERIVRQKWNVLIINNNPQTNGGYYFTEFEWFKNGEKINNASQYYSGDIDGILNPKDLFSIDMNTTKGVKLSTCEGSPSEETAEEIPPAFKKRILGIDSKSPQSGKIYNIKGERSNGKAPGVYLIKENE
ncbi:MAG: hypothetical protein FWH22_09915, partial [Fibromonadales bacterium]|nr:hypothetical protein [Fibromonadales bacterium]